MPGTSFFSKLNHIKARKYNNSISDDKKLGRFVLGGKLRAKDAYRYAYDDNRDVQK